MLLIALSRDSRTLTINGMQGVMDQRFQEILQGLAALQGEPRRKARQDAADDNRGGRATTRWAAANVTSLPRRWEEVAQAQAHVLCLTETLVHGVDHQWLRTAFRSKGRQFLPGASCHVVGALNARKWGVGFLLQEDCCAAYARG